MKRIVTLLLSILSNVKQEPSNIMKILIVSSYLPYPLFSGGHIRLYNIIKGLTKKKHQVTLVCEKRNHQTDDDRKELEKICYRVITIDRKKQWSLQNILKTGFSKNAFLITGHESQEMREKIQAVLDSDTFDLIHVETSYVMQNVPETPVPLILVEHNIEYLVYDRFVRRTPLLMRPLLTLDVLKLKQFEIKAWRRATHVVTVSDVEKEIVAESKVSVTTVPNGVDLTKFVIKDVQKTLEKKKKKILFIGDFKWIQNRDAATWIITKLWVRIQKVSDASLWIVGKKIPQSIKQLDTHTSIIFDENSSKDTSDIFKEADILLAPIRVGAGTQYKILEAMASGTPVVTTTLGAIGIEAEMGKNILVADDETGLVQNVISLLEDKTLYQKIASNARKLIEEKYDWEKIVTTLEHVYKGVL